MSELSPEKLKLLKLAVDVQERIINGCEQIFRGLSDHDDPEVSSVSRQCAEHIEHHRDVLDALVDALSETKH